MPVGQGKVRLVLNVRPETHQLIFQMSQMHKIPMAEVVERTFEAFAFRLLERELPDILAKTETLK